MRIAIGASPAQVLGMVLQEGLLQVLLGLAVGTALAIATSRLLSGLLFGVTIASVTPYIVVSVLLAAVTLLACAAPARRAMRVDPVNALRAD